MLSFWSFEASTDVVAGISGIGALLCMLVEVSFAAAGVGVIGAPGGGAGGDILAATALALDVSVPLPLALPWMCL